MKRSLFSLFAVLIMAVSMIIGNEGCTRINPGYVGIVINMAGDQKGVDQMPTTTGWTTYNPLTQSVYEFPTSTQTAKWTRSAEEGNPINEEVAYNSIEGLSITSDISLSFSMVDSLVPHFYVKFRNDDLNSFLHGYMRNVARDAFNETASKMKIDDIYGAGKSDLLAAVRAHVNREVAKFGVQIEQFGFIGEQRLPPSVVAQIEAKIGATQEAIKTENQIRTSKAQAEINVNDARGRAEANRLLAGSISPQLVQWEQIQLMKLKWDGAMPNVMAGGGGMSLLVQTPAK